MPKEGLLKRLRKKRARTKFAESAYKSNKSKEALLNELVFQSKLVNSPREAAKLLKREAKAHPDDWEYQHKIGLALSEIGSHNDAIQQNKKVIVHYVREPKDTKSFHILGDSSQAIATSLEKVCAPLKADEKEQINQFHSKAIDWFHEAFRQEKRIESLSKMAKALEQRGDFLAKHGNIDAASIDYQGAKDTRNLIRKLGKNKGAMQKA